ncbi:oligosaccharide flippase family protein [bacterium]|nr:oligosaccharide flippase family protein [bacterium]
MTEHRLVWRHSRIYGLGNLLNRAAGLVLIPLYAQVLTPTEFGVYAIVGMATEWLAILVGMGLGSSMSRIYFDFDDEDARSRIVSTAFLGFTGMAALFGLSIPLLSDLSSRVFFEAPVHAGLFRVAYAALIFNTLFTIELNYLRIRKNSWAYLWVSLAKSLLLFGLNIYFVASMGLGVAGILYGNLLAVSTVSIGLGAVVLSRVGLRFSLSSLRAMVRFGAPLVASTLADSSLNAVDKFFLNRLVSTMAVGAYALGGRVAILLHMFVTAPFGQIWIVRRLETLGKSADEVEHARIFTMFLGALTAGALGLSLLAPEIVHVVASAEYADAVRIVPLMAGAYVLMGVKMHFEIGIFHAKQTKWIAMISVACLAVDIPMIWALVGAFGALGAAAGMLGINILRTGLTAYAGIRCMEGRMRFEWGKGIAIVTTGIACYAAAARFLDMSPGAAFAAPRAALVLAFAAGVYFAVRPGRRTAPAAPGEET